MDKFSSQLFKGIALFTPGGDLIYGIDPSKQEQWHLHLCVALQELLGLPEPPHFLVPGYTATIDRWIDPETQQLQTAAEIAIPVRRHQILLNTIFGTPNLVWQETWQEETCDPMVIESYRPQFPQLWEDRDLMIRLARGSEKDGESQLLKAAMTVNTPENVLHLFVSGNKAVTEQTLLTLHQLLERSQLHPYTLKVIDVFKHPDQAELHQISATPTLVRVFPQPVRRIVGELNDVEKVLRILGK